MWFFGEEPIDTDINGEINGIKRVAAGDPTIVRAPIKGQDELPKTIKTGSGNFIDVSKYTVFEVIGSSMSPEDISNGDKLLCELVTAEEATTIQKGVFAIIEVDPAYYEAKHKSLKYGYKLRHTLYNIPVGTSIEDLKESLKGVTTSIALPKNKKLLESKYKEALDFYKKCHLMLSLTYKEGVLRYSFHPVNLIKYKAVYLLKYNGTDWRAEKILK